MMTGGKYWLWRTFTDVTNWFMVVVDEVVITFLAEASSNKVFDILNRDASDDLKNSDSLEYRETEENRNENEEKDSKKEHEENNFQFSTLRSLQNTLFIFINFKKDLLVCCNISG